MPTPTFIPLGDRLLVRRNSAPEKVGALFIPEQGKTKPLQGEVLAAGSGRRLSDGSHIAMQTKPGDVVYFGQYAGDEITLGGEDFLVLREEDIFGVVPRPA